MSKSNVSGWLLALALVAGGGDAAAQIHGHLLAPQRGGMMTLLKKNGTQIRGKVQEVDLDKRRAKFEIRQGGAVMRDWIGIDEFTPASAVEVAQTLVAADDAAGHLKLATFAAGLGELGAAKRALSCARKISNDPDYGADVAAKIESQGLAAAEQQFLDQVEAGKLDDATTTLLAMRQDYPEEISGGREQRLQATLDAKAQQLATDRESAAADRAKQEAAAKRDKVTRGIEKKIEAGEKRNLDGLRQSRRPGRALNLMRGATQAFDSARRDIARDKKRYANDGVLVAQLGALDVRAAKGNEQAILNQASLQLTRGQINDAMGQVNTILADDPGNQAALAMRARIESAANRGWGYGW